MLRWTFITTALLAMLAGTTALALEDGKQDKEKLRQEILRKVEERLKAENKRVMDEVRKILEEELKRMDEEEEPAPVKPPKKEPPKKDPPKKEPPKKSEPGYMGVYPEDISAEMRKLLKLKPDQGVLIAGVSENGPAAKGGLKANDVVLEVDGEPVGSGEELREAIQEHKAGETVDLLVLRKKEKLELSVKLASRQAIEEEEEGGEDEEEDEEEPPAKPATKKPKVIFEPRAESPKFDEKTEAELRKEIERFLDEHLEKQPAPKTPKLLIPGERFFIGEDEDGEDDEPAGKPGREMRELAKRFLRDLLEKLEEEPGEDPEEEEPGFGFDEELRRMMEKFEGLRGEEMEKLQEKFQEMMEKLKDEDYLRELMEGLNKGDLRDQLERFLGQGGGGEDEEDLTDPDEEEAPAPRQPQPAPKGGAWLGVQPEDLSPEMRRQLKVESGVLVREVVEESPAEEAGLKDGDILLEINGEAIEGPEGLRAALAGLKGGTKATLTILRKGKRIEKDVTLAAKRKISIPSKAAPATFDIEDKKPSKKKSGAGDKKRTEEFHFAVLDGDGRTILKVPARDAAKLMEMARAAGIPLPGLEGSAGKGALGKLLGDGGGDGKKKDSKKRAKKPGAQKKDGRHGADELHDLFRKFQGRGAGEWRELLERHGREFLKKGGREFEFDGKRLELEKLFRGRGPQEGRRILERVIPPGARGWMERSGGPVCPHGCPECRKKEQGMKRGDGARKVERKEFRIPPKGKDWREGHEFEFEFELEKPKAPKKKTVERESDRRGAPKAKPAPRGKGSVEEEMGKARREIEKALKEFGGDRMPEELREELKELLKDLQEKQPKGRSRKMIAA